MHRLIVIAFAAIGLSSCATAPQSSGEESSASAAFQSASNSLGHALSSFGSVLSGLLNPQLAELKRYVEANELDKAADFYIAHEDELPKNDQARALLATLVEKLNEAYAGKNGQYGAGFEELAAGLEARKVPGETADWPALRSDLASARKRFALYDGVVLLKRPEYRSPSHARLDKAVGAISQHLIESADASFATYDHLRPEAFFDVYPEDLGAQRDRVLKRGYAAWTAPLAKAPLADVERVVRLYGSSVDDEQRRLSLSNTVLGAMVRENRWRTPLAMAQSLRAAESLAALSLPVPASLQRVEMVVIASDEAQASAWSKARPGTEVKIVNPPQFDALLRQLARAKVDRPRLLVDVTARFSQKGMTQVATRSSERVIAQREEPNPEWDSASSDYREAQQRAQQAREMDAATQAQAQQLGAMGGLSQLQALTAIGASGMSTFGAQAAERDVNEARTRLQSTPRTIFKPVTESYPIGAATYEAVRGQRVTIYAVEPRATRFKRYEISDVSRSSAQIEIGLDPHDPRKAEADRRASDALAGLDRFMAAGQAPEPAQVIAHVTSAKATEHPLSALAAQRTADQRSWQSLAAAETSRLAAHADAAGRRAEQFSQRPRTATADVPRQRLASRPSRARAEDDEPAPPANPFAANPFMPKNLQAPPARTKAAANLGGGGGGGYDCRSEEQRIQRMLSSAGQGGDSICQSGKDMLRIANEALPFYERCPISDPKGEMRAWLRDTKVKAQGMVDSSCVDTPAARPRSSFSQPSAPAARPAPRPAPQPTYTRGSPGGGLR